MPNPINRYCNLFQVSGKLATQYVYTCPNGYGLSAICHADSYGGLEGLWEVAVLNPDGGIDYSTPITSDVIGWLEPTQVAEIVLQVAALETDNA
jgi:hypothetical protein